MLVFYSLLLSTMDEQSLAVCLLILFLVNPASAATKDQLSTKLPLERNAPLLSSLLVDNGVVVLEVGAEALSLKRDPQGILVHGVGLLRPVAEVVCVFRECLAELLDGFRVFVEEDLARLC
jgi:hypothetical protein